MPARNGQADIEKGLLDTVGEGESGMNGESSINIYTLPYVKQRAGEKWLFNTGSPRISSVMI